MTYNTGRAAIYWSWYCSPRRNGGWSYGKNNIGNRAYSPETHDFGDYPGWKVMVSYPNQRYGMAGGNRGAKRKVHMVRDQIIAKHALHPEERMSRWLCGAYTFQGVLQAEATMVCSQCLMVSQRRFMDPVPPSTKVS